MGELSKRLVDLDPKYMIHMGSETIPPCKENIIHITLDQPLEIPSCQFALLRTNSLVSTRAREIHTRFEVPGSDRPVYYFNKKALSYIPSISGIVPESYKKYTLGKNVKNVKNAKNARKNGKASKNGKGLSKNILKNKNNSGFGPGYINGKKTESDGSCKV